MHEWGGIMNPKSAPSITSGWDLVELAGLIEELTRLRDAQLEHVSRLAPELRRIPESNLPSARNLLHYLSLRKHDLRRLQSTLARLGLSSLGRSERHVMFNVTSVLKLLHHLVHRSWQVPPGSEDILAGHEGHDLLERRAEGLLGPKPAQRGARIMVTMPSEAATDAAFVRKLLESGMNVMRINCAHDGPKAWEAMVRHLKRAMQELGKPCRILMDLAGPKIRTGPMAPGPRVLHWKPTRDAFGHPTKPVRVWLTPEEAPETPPEPAQASLPLPRAWLSRLEGGDSVRFKDTRQARRTLKIVAAAGASRWAESNDTCYLEPGLRLWVRGHKDRAARVGELPPLEPALHLERGDVVVLTRQPVPGVPASAGSPARISCTLPDVLDDVQPGEHVWFDDGKIGGTIRALRPEGAEVEIVHARHGGEKLGADKGINLPDSSLRTPALTEKDVEDLAFVAAHADMVGYSFVRDPEDVRKLQERLCALRREDLGIVLKIETRRAFENLPKLLLAALNGTAPGVMIARGDLAVECGYERLAEVQEEILWLCEAAHVPVVWATQVLERMTKDGLPSRAEVTDAAMGERAECVMLNKGPYLLEALSTLDDILRRMEAHQSKKTPTLRPLRVASAAFAEKA
jgi:pyruvate kinase